MKHFLKIIILLVLAFPLQGCHKEPQEEVERRSMLLYICGNNNLSSYARDCIDQLKMGYIPDDKSKDEEVLLVFYHVPGAAPTLTRLYKSAEGKICEEILSIYAEDMNSATIESFSNVTADAERSYPSDKHGLVLWSHATGYLPVGYFNDPKELTRPSLVEDPYAGLVRSSDEDSRSFGNQDDSEIDIRDLADALKNHYEFIIFDCCLMGGIEVAYEFKDKCDYVLFSPTEIMAKGFPYETMMDAVFHLEDREGAFTSICKTYFDYYQAQSGVNRSATITLVDNRKLSPVAEVCKDIFASHRNEILSINRNNIQAYFRYNKHWYYDMGDFIENISSEQEYASFCNALDEAIIYKAATERFISIDIVKYSGLSIYIPKTSYEYLNNYYKTLAWNEATGLVE